MSKANLRSYAPQARKDFIAAVEARAAQFGISADAISDESRQGDVVIVEGRPLGARAAVQRQALVSRIAARGFASVIDEVAFTWFNRFAAIRYMEINGVLRHGYRVLSPAEGQSRPEVLVRAEHVDLPGLDRDQVVDMKMRGDRDEELYKMLLLAQCHDLHQSMPFLFEAIDDETELLLPDGLLGAGSVIKGMVEAIPEEDWREIEIVGWLYQYYILERKGEVIGKVVAAADIPAATQLFTPNWIVKYMVQNTLGHKWLATYPESRLKGAMEYFIAPARQTGGVDERLARSETGELDPESITLLDPACGSGHILVEAYDLFREIYAERGYRPRDAARLILEKNIYGLDIDPRAAQMAGFALMMKAFRDDRRILERRPTLNIMAVRSSQDIDVVQINQSLFPTKRVELIPADDLMPETKREPTLAINERPLSEKKDVEALLSLFQNAGCYGSLIRIPDKVVSALGAMGLAVERAAMRDVFARTAADDFQPFLKQAHLLSRTYTCVVANPPYMGAKFFCRDLAAFAKKHFEAARHDLYACFMIRAAELCEENGFVAQINIPGWMTNSTFKEFRDQFLAAATITSLVHNGRGVFGSDFGSCAFSAVRRVEPNFKATYKRLFDNQSEVQSNDVLRRRFHTAEPYVVSHGELAVIPGHPISYSASVVLRGIFRDFPPISNVCDARQGLSTSDAPRFVRQWYELAVSEIAFTCSSGDEAKQCGRRWFPLNKGGEYRKWFGNVETVVNWNNGGEEIKALRPKSVVRNEDRYFQECVTWSDYTIGDSSFRFQPAGAIFANTGHCAFLHQDDRPLVLGFLNSRVLKSMAGCLSPTVHFDVGYFKQIRYKEASSEAVARNVQKAISLAKADWALNERSWEYSGPALLATGEPSGSIKEAFDKWEKLSVSRVAEMRELETFNNQFFIDAYGLSKELTPDVPENQITLAKASRGDEIRNLISYFIGCKMGRYSLDEAGLIYAGLEGTGFDGSRYRTVSADEDGILPVLEDDWFEDDAANRFFEFVSTAWPSDGIADNLRYVADSLGPKADEAPKETIRRYFAQGFYKDHLKTYRNRPIYWLFSSGKERAFQCLVYLHRYNEGTLSRMRMSYVVGLQRSIANRLEDALKEIDSAKTTADRNDWTKKADALRRQAAELQAFDEKLRNMADRRIRLDLNDGVRINYAKFGDLLAEARTVTGDKDE